MAVQCSTCGEELLGAVNRCWKCGSPFAAPPAASSAPPIRRTPIAQIYPGVPASPYADIATADTVLATASGASGQPATKRRGSPFSDQHTQALPKAVPPRIMVRTGHAPADYSYASAANGGAIGALLLGIIGLCVSYYFPAGALALALLGIGLGLWGLYSDWRGVAITGLVLCCLTLGLAGFFGAVDLFVFLNGRHPWEAAPALEPEF